MYLNHKESWLDGSVNGLLGMAVRVYKFIVGRAGAGGTLKLSDFSLADLIYRFKERPCLKT